MTDPTTCRSCGAPLSPQELGHTLCLKCAAKDMAKRIGEALIDLPGDWYIDLPGDWYDHTPDKGQK